MSVLHVIYVLLFLEIHIQLYYVGVYFFCNSCTALISKLYFQLFFVGLLNWKVEVGHQHEHHNFSMKNCIVIRVENNHKLSIQLLMNPASLERRAKFSSRHLHLIVIYRMDFSFGITVYYIGIYV